MRQVFAFALALFGLCLGSAQTIDHAKSLAMSASVKDRLAAVAEYRRIPTPASFAALAELFKDQERAVRSAAVEAFKVVLNAYDDPIRAAITATKDPRKQEEMEKQRAPTWEYAHFLQMDKYLEKGLDDLAQPGPEAARALILQMAKEIGLEDQPPGDDEEWIGRCGTGYNFAADAMFHYAVARRPEVALSLLADPSIRIKGGLIEALGRARAESALPELIAFTRSSHNGLRLSAVGALAHFHTKATFDIAAAMVKDRATQVRSRVATTLAALDAQRATPILIEMLGDRSSSVFWSAARGLKNVKDERIARRLLDILLASSSDQWQIVCEAIADHPSRIFEPALLRLLEDPDENTRVFVIKTLSKMPGESIRNLMVRLARAKEPAIRAAAVYGLGRWNEPQVWELLQGLLKDDNATVVWAACYELGEMKVTSALADLRSVKLDDEFIKDAVAEAIAKITGRIDPP